MSAQEVLPFPDATRRPLEEPRTAPYQAHSPTSCAAARRAEPRAGTARARVLELLRAVGPLTDEQIATRLAMNPSTERPRRVELVEDGYVAAAGQAVTSSGSAAVLWGAVPQGAELEVAR